MSQIDDKVQAADAQSGLVHRPPLGPVAFENERVSFRWRDYAHGSKKKIRFRP